MVPDSLVENLLDPAFQSKPTNEIKEPFDYFKDLARDFIKSLCMKLVKIRKNCGIPLCNTKASNDMYGNI